MPFKWNWKPASSTGEDNGNSNYLDRDQYLDRQTTSYYSRHFVHVVLVYDYLYNKERPLSEYDQEGQPFIDFGSMLNDRKSSVVEDIRLEVPNEDILQVHTFLSGL